ncbi:histidine phosphatase family protein [Roseateles violae]|uniref:Histidine phosphatase family protein n=1 Tax=Roseateles violae TaxID=3058042 RepID=A0ABT8DLG6_9BURK|nr:histidine phosphatase family protein [Pelomonas sp. PFR6]MDN3919256.1 histidine phosphatase family protein [Pelomonas sp. PFR6]
MLPKNIDRRHLLVAGLAAPWLSAAAQPAPDAQALLQAGGVVLALRHALAPGTQDPPNFRLGDCGTQRNLNEEGRAQARRLGAWLAERGLHPARVRSSPWCRCLETARLAFGEAEPWPALGSPRAGSDSANAAALIQLRGALSEAAAHPGRFEAWVTHMFVLSALLNVGTAAGEGLVLGLGADGAPRLLGRLLVA